MSKINNQEKYKRRTTKPQKLKNVGNLENGKVYYPKSIKSTKRIWGDYHIRMFQIETSYRSILTKEKIPLKMSFWYYIDADTLEEYLGIECLTTPILAERKRFNWLVDDIYKSDQEPFKSSTPRKLIVPHRKTLDNYGLNICVFQKDNYLGIPLVVSSLDKQEITVSWVYLYNTVFNGTESIYFETEYEYSLCLKGNVYLY